MAHITSLILAGGAPKPKHQSRDQLFPLPRSPRSALVTQALRVEGGLEEPSNTPCTHQPAGWVEADCLPTQRRHFVQPLVKKWATATWKMPRHLDIRRHHPTAKVGFRTYASHISPRSLVPALTTIVLRSMVYAEESRWTASLPSSPVKHRSSRASDSRQPGRDRVRRASGATSSKSTREYHPLDSYRLQVTPSQRSKRAGSRGIGTALRSLVQHDRSVLRSPEM